MADMLETLDSLKGKFFRMPERDEEDQRHVPFGINLLQREPEEPFLDAQRLGGFYELRPVSNWELYLETERSDFYRRIRRRVLVTARRKDFKLIKTIGTGAFSKVMLVKHLRSKTFYALKICDKQILVYTKKVENVINERKALRAIRFPFMVHSEYFFQNFTYVFFALPVCLGGEVGFYIREYGALSEYFAKFIVAQVILALEYLHYMDVIYRGLKPENVVIDHDGFIKITDFGNCKFMYGSTRTFSMCGTPQYMAPEMLATSGHGKAVDYWQLGVFIYELVSGVTPFFAMETIQIYKLILENTYYMPSHSTYSLRHLFRKLLKAIPEARLGSVNGFKDIKEHPWFENILWIPLLNKQVVPPYIPHLDDVLDTRLFDEFEEKPLYHTRKNTWYREFRDL